MRLVSNAPVPSDTYDTFGNTISVKDGNGNIITNPNNIGIINPYRYRGYRYDYESGLYYLNSRYYVPEWGRFLNGDNYGGQLGEILTHNIYAYCLNNPINNVDYDGNVATEAIAIWLTKKAVEFGIAVVATWATAGTIAMTEKVVDKVKDKTSSKDKTITTNPPSFYNNTVYTLINDNTGVVEYVGRTSRHPEIRAMEHKKNPNRAHLTFKIERRNLTRAEARGLEQLLIDRYKTLNRGKPAANQRNGIYLYNPHRIDYLNAAKAVLGETETYVGP